MMVEANVTAVAKLPDGITTKQVREEVERMMRDAADMNGVGLESLSVNVLEASVDGNS